MSMHYQQRLLYRLFTTAAIVLLTSLTCLAQNDDTGYDEVTISIATPSYDATKAPEIARVKYNKKYPLVITSDDMGRTEFLRNWAFFNGYPVCKDPGGKFDDFMTLLNAPYNATTLSYQEPEMKDSLLKPLTYTDNTGGKRRFSATSAIMPYKIGGNYTLLNEGQAKVMIRTGWSFAQHDVADSFNGVSDVDKYIKEQLPIQSKKMEDITGVGLKIIVEPNGDHRYIKAGVESQEICWNIFQNSTNEYPNNSALISDWTAGADITGFDSKPTGAFERYFFQGHESEWSSKVLEADGTKIIMGGTHGISDEALLLMKEIERKDNYWVASADEVWEYYHLYNNAEISDVVYADEHLTFKVKVPKYKKHQFRELTINIPGITDGTATTFSSNVITGGARQNDGQYTINIGLEDNIYTHIEELIALYRANLHNQYLKRDAQYLIDRLLPSTKKDNYQSQIDKAPNYTYTIKAVSPDNQLNTTLLAADSDEATAVSYAIPKYILDGTTLYRTDGNNTEPHFVSEFTPTQPTEEIAITYKKHDDNVVFYSEGEDLDGAEPITDVATTTSKGTGSKYWAFAWASNGVGGAIKKKVAITTLEPGIYKLVAGVGDSWHDANRSATFTFKLDGETICQFQTTKYGTEEFAKEDIIVKSGEGQTLTAEATDNGNARWLDYVYLQKTDDYDPSAPNVELSTETTKINMTRNGATIAMTVATTPQTGATISNTTVKLRGTDETISVADGAASYSFQKVGSYIFYAESTDSEGRIGRSQTVTIDVTASHIIKSTEGDILTDHEYGTDNVDESYVCAYPRYYLKENTLFSIQRNSNTPHYAESVTLTDAGTVSTKSYDSYMSNVVFYSEGEDLDGAESITADITTQHKDNDGSRYWALAWGSNGVGGAIKKQLNVTTLQPGIYKLIAGVGDSWHDANHYATFNFKLNGVSVYQFQTDSAGVKEYTQSDIIVKDAAPLTVEATNNGNARWLDYLIIQRTSEYDLTTPDVALTANTAIIKMSDGETTATLTATATKNGTADIMRTTIFDENGQELASAEGDECHYDFHPTTLGTYHFYATASTATLTGQSAPLTVSATADLSYSIVSSEGDILSSVELTNQTTYADILYTYPRYYLKGTDLYELEAANTGTEKDKLHYGGQLLLKEKGKTIDIPATKANEDVVFYIEGESLPGAEKRTNTLDTNSKGPGEPYWGLILGSDGAGGGFNDGKTASVTSLPSGTYQLTVALGESYLAQRKQDQDKFTFTAGSTTILEATTQHDMQVEEFTSEPFTLDNTTDISVKINVSNRNARWIDYIYIREIIPEVVSLEGIAFTEDRHWATYYSDIDLQTPAGLQAYVVTGINDDAVAVKAIDYIPQETGILLYSETPGSDFTTIAGSGTASSSLLKGSNSPFEIEAYGGYVLYNNAFTLSSGGMLAAHRCYLPVPLAASAPRQYLSISNGTTGLPIIKSTNEQPLWFDLQGRRMIYPSRKGIYIVNGKKIAIK